MEVQVLRRTMDAAFVNAVANDPTVRPLIGNPDDGPLDFAAFLADPANVALTWEWGAFLFARHDPARYELHTLILPEGRGAGVLPAFADAARWVFTATDASELVTQVAGSNRAAGLMARRAGFRPIFEREGAWHDGSGVTFFAFGLDDWRARDDTLALEGRAFHEALEAAKAAAGSTLPPHPDDEAHDRAVGAACLMAKAGNPRKAAHTYNRWARFAGYAPAALVAEAPPVFDIGEAVFAFTPELEIMKCQQQL
jgi:hypothetical protein